VAPVRLRVSQMGARRDIACAILIWELQFYQIDSLVELACVVRCIWGCTFPMRGEAHLHFFESYQHYAQRGDQKHGGHRHVKSTTWKKHRAQKIK